MHLRQLKLRFVSHQKAAAQKLSWKLRKGRTKCFLAFLGKHTVHDNNIRKYMSYTYTLLSAPDRFPEGGNNNHYRFNLDLPWKEAAKMYKVIGKYTWAWAYLVERRKLMTHNEGFNSMTFLNIKLFKKCRPLFHRILDWPNIRLVSQTCHTQ